MIDTTLAGRCYRTMDIQSASLEDGGVRVWAPVLDGVERLGVLELLSGGEEPDLDELRVIANLIAEVVMTKQGTGDDLAGSAAAIDGAINKQFGLDRFVTAVLPKLDLASGTLRWSVSGHPASLLLRKGRIVKSLVGEGDTSARGRRRRGGH